VLQVRDLCVSDRRRKIELLRGVSLDVHAGEVLGIAGVEGNGQTELVETLIGLIKADKGSIQLDGVRLLGGTPRKIMEAGLACIHEDRQGKGLIAGFTISENLILGAHYREPIRRGMMMDQGTIERIAAQRVAAYDIRPPVPKMQAKYLSGGNQQKLIIARELHTKDMKVLVASQPTRGLDISATNFVHRTLCEMRDRGIAVLFISADLDEIKLMSDRIAVMYRGEIVATAPKEAFSDLRLGSLMLTGQETATEETGDAG